MHHIMLTTKLAMLITQYQKLATMVCTLVKGADLFVQDSKHLQVHWNSINNLQPSSGHHRLKSGKHEDNLLQRSTNCGDDMGTLIITQQFAPASLRLAAASSRPSFLKRSTSGKKSMWDFCPCEGAGIFSKHSRTCILLLLGFLLCFSFICAHCKVDANIRIAGKRTAQESRLMGFRGNTERLCKGHCIDNMGYASPSHTHTERFYKGHIVEDMGYTSPSHTHVEDITVKATHLHREAALHGLGLVFSKGTKPMHNLIIANLEESCDMLDFRLFLRTLYRSGAMAKADLVLLFPWPSLPQVVSDVLQEEDNSFKKLITMNLESPVSSTGHANDISIFNHLAFEAGLSNKKVDDAKSTDKKRAYIIWGKNTSSSNHESEAPNYGSVVGFHMNELDSIDGFSEFLINPSSQLRRWLCYQMLLGLLRYKFKLVMLAELGGVVILGDVFSQVKEKDSLYLTLEDLTWANTTAECNHVTQLQGERQSPLSRGMHDDDQFKGLLEHDENLQTVPLRHGAVEIMVKRIHDNGHVVHNNMLNAQGLRGASKKKRVVNEHRKGLVLRSRKQDQSTHDQGDNEGNEIIEEERIVMRSRPNAKEKTMHDMVKPNVRMKGHGGEKLSLMEMVYGKEVWESLEQVEKERRVVSSRVIFGSMRSAKGLANSMAIETVRVALQRNSKVSFPDRALLSYLVQKSTHLLGKRITESLKMMGNRESMVHIVDRSKQENVFVRHYDGQKYTIVHAGSLNMRPVLMPSDQRGQSMMSDLTLNHLIRANICASTANSAALYHDCGLEQAL